ncbi:MAG: hypothetical protein M3072_15130 [Candidatus Dormibacteraeota bacterium]|nr:hypothetical protein [Candidatus Dormibacteraeota bacterium]
MLEMTGETDERRVGREDAFAAVRELLQLARRCVSPFEDGEESTYTQADALDDLEEWLRERTERR